MRVSTIDSENLVSFSFPRNDFEEVHGVSCLQFEIPRKGHWLGAVIAFMTRQSSPSRRKSEIVTEHSRVTRFCRSVHFLRKSQRRRCRKEIDGNCPTSRPDFPFHRAGLTMVVAVAKRCFNWNWRLFYGLRSSCHGCSCRRRQVRSFDVSFGLRVAATMTMLCGRDRRCSNRGKPEASYSHFCPTAIIYDENVAQCPTSNRFPFLYMSISDANVSVA